MIVTASWDKTAKVWDSEGNLVADLVGHTDRVRSAAFSPDGSKVLTTSEDGTVRLWNLEGDELAVITTTEPFGPYAAFSPDGSMILVVDGSVVSLWRVFATSAEMVPVIQSKIGRALTAAECEQYLGFYCQR